MANPSIIPKLQERLNRDLKPKEIYAFSMDRTTTAYQLMLDYIEDKERSSVELEQYVEFIVQESI